jgi:hypothetical protein
MEFIHSFPADAVRLISIMSRRLFEYLRNSLASNHKSIEKQFVVIFHKQYLIKYKKYDILNNALGIMVDKIVRLWRCVIVKTVQYICIIS